MKRVLLVMLILATVACALWLIGFIAIDHGPLGTSFYVGPVEFSASVNLSSWFPGKYL